MAYWLVNFPQYGEKENIATLEIKEDDLKLIPVMQAIVNEQITEQFENMEKSGNNSKPFHGEMEWDMLHLSQDGWWSQTENFD